MSNNQRHPAKETYWREVNERQRASGLSVRAFCRREGVAETSLHAWRRTIARCDGIATPPLARGTGFSLDRWLGQEGVKQTFSQAGQGFDASRKK